MQLIEKNAKNANASDFFHRHCNLCNDI